MNETQTPVHVPVQLDTPAPGGPRLPTWARWVVAALGMMVTVLAGSLVITLVAGLGPGVWLEADHTGLAAVGQVLLYTAIHTAPLLVAFLLLWGLSRLDRVRVRDYLGRGRRGALRFGGYAAAAAVPTAAVGLALGALGADADRGGAEFTSSSTILVVTALVCSAVLVQGIPEELWFRGMAWANAGRRPWVTLAGTTVVFSALHLVSAGGQESVGERVVYLVLPLGMGFLAGCARWCTGSVWAAAGTHSGFHLGMIPVYLLAIPTGPVAWITLGGAQLLAGALLLVVRRPWRRRT